MTTNPSSESGGFQPTQPTGEESNNEASNPRPDSDFAGSIAAAAAGEGVAQPTTQGEVDEFLAKQEDNGVNPLEGGPGGSDLNNSGLGGLR